MRSQAKTAVLALSLAVLTGCAEETRNVPGSAKSPAPPKEEPEDTFIVGKRTQQIGNAEDPALKQGAEVASQRIVAKDPISLSGNAYVTMIGRTSILSIEHALNLYKATNDRFPSSHEEFMTEIIKANNIALPKLPFYQEYVYNVEQHKLLIYEYPEKKAGPLPGQAR